MDIQKLIKLGGQVGLEGDDLRKWVDEKIKEETERKEKERQAAREDREREVAIKEKEREAEKAMLEMQIELERVRKPDPVASSSGSSGVIMKAPFAKSPRIPPFNDSKGDNIDSYLLRFERYATVNKWEEADWSLHLSASLTGKALDVYTRMDVTSASDYGKLREALLNRYNLTEEGFATKFRNSRPENGERMGEFKTRASTYLDKWLAMAGKDKAKPDEIMDLVLKEQLMNACSKDLRTFLKERKPKTSDELVELAENYVEAHGTARAFARHQTNNMVVEKGVLQMDSEPKAPAPQGKVTCHKCLKPGHLTRGCRTNQPARRQVYSMRADIVCTYCGRRGHDETRCWERGRAVDNRNTEKCEGHERMELECGCALPVISASCVLGDKNSPRMPVATGYMNGRRVTVLRDSGCSSVVVRKGLLPQRKGLSKKTVVHLINGTTVSAPLSEIYLDSPYFKGKVVAAEMDTPLYDVIIGNIPGVKCPEIDVNTGISSRRTENYESKPLTPRKYLGINVTMNELIEKQKEDESLHRCRQLAKTGEVMRTGRSSRTWYGYDDQGVLFRYFESNRCGKGNVLRQVVIPRGFRNAVIKLTHEKILARHFSAKKTTEKILQDFFWPNVWTDVSRFSQSCQQCRRSTKK